jgi:segregation and condensation protein B
VSGDDDSFEDEPTRAKQKPLLPDNEPANADESDGAHAVDGADAADGEHAADGADAADGEGVEAGEGADEPGSEEISESFGESVGEIDGATTGDEEPTTIHAPAPDESARLVSIVESLLFAADKPLALKSIGDLLGENDLGKIRAAVASVEEAYASRGVQLHSVAGGYQFRTNAENATWVQKLLAQKPVRLTRAQLETLAIVAYRQPITRPEIDQIRGVDSGGTLKTLMDRLLLRILGKKEEPGRPMLYGTTREFLEFFNLGDLKDLPTLREFHELTEEHQAQVAALESVAPEGSIDDTAEATAPPPLQRVELGAGPADDTAELDEIDRLIATADSGPPPPKPDADPDPKAEG